LASPLQNPAATPDLISCLKALSDCRMRRGSRYPQWWMLMGMERFAKRHRQTLNKLLGTDVAKLT